MSLDASHQLGQTVGAKLRAARQVKKYTQSQLAHPEFSVSYISAIERGQIQPSLRALEILTKRLDITPADVLPQQKALEGESLSAPEEAFSAKDTRSLAILEARIAFHQDAPDQAIAILRTLLAQKGKQTILLSLLLAQAYLQGGYIQESEQILSAVTTHSQKKSDFLEAHLISLQSLVYMATHNTNRAVALQRESLAKLEQIVGSDIFLLARFYNNLGQQYSYLEQWDQAEELFNRAQYLLRKRTTGQEVQEVYWNLLQEYKSQEEWSEAIYYSYKCLLANAHDHWVILKSEIQHELNRALFKSAPREAYEYLLVEVQKQGESQNILARASAHTYLATWFMKRGDLDKAEFHAHQASTLAEPFGMTAIYADACLLSGELAYQRQNYQEGDSCFESGLAMLEGLGRQQELVEYLTSYANLLESNNFISKALLYWKRAYECGQKNGDESL